MLNTNTQELYKVLEQIADGLSDVTKPRQDYSLVNGVFEPTDEDLIKADILVNNLLPTIRLETPVVRFMCVAQLLFRESAMLKDEGFDVGSLGELDSTAMLAFAFGKMAADVDEYEEVPSIMDEIEALEEEMEQDSYLDDENLEFLRSIETEDAANEVATTSDALTMGKIIRVLQQAGTRIPLSAEAEAELAMQEQTHAELLEPELLERKRDFGLQSLSDEELRVMDGQVGDLEQVSSLPKEEIVAFAERVKQEIAKAKPTLDDVSTGEAVSDEHKE
jgi:hypothetical protein